jgi:hypothetical protein
MGIHAFNVFIVAFFIVNGEQKFPVGSSNFTANGLCETLTHIQHLQASAIVLTCDNLLPCMHSCSWRGWRRVWLPVLPWLHGVS